MNHVLSDWKVDFFFPKIIKVLFKLLPPLKHGNDSTTSSVKINGIVSNNKAGSKKDELDNHIISEDNDNYHLKIHDYYSDKDIKQLHQYILTLCRYITSLHPNYTLYYFTNIYHDDDIDVNYRYTSLSAAAIDTVITPTKSKSNIGYHLFSTNHSKSSSPTSTNNNNINNNNNNNSSNTVRNLTYYSYIIKCLQNNLFLNDPSTESAAFLLLDTLCCYSDKMKQAIQSEISIEFLKNKINILIPSVTEKVSKLFVTLYGINLEYSSNRSSRSSSNFYNNKMKSTTATNSNNIVVDSNSSINHHHHHHHAKSVEEISCLQYIFEVILQITQNKLQKLNQTKHNNHASSLSSSSLASKYQPNINNNHNNKNNNDYDFDKDDNNNTDNSTSISSCFDCMFNIIYIIGMKIQIYKIDSLHDVITKIITLISNQFHDLSQFQLSDIHIIDIFFILVGKIEKSWLLINNIITPTSTTTDCVSSSSSSSSSSSRSSNNVGTSNGRSSASNHADIIEYEFSKQSIILIEHFSRIAMTYDILYDPTKNANTNNNINKNNNNTNITTNNVIYSSSGINNNDDENINYKFTKSTLSDDEFDDDDDDNNVNNNYDDYDDDDDDDDYPHSNHLSNNNNNNNKTYLNSKNIEFFRLFLSNAKFDLFINEFLQQWELDPIELTCKLINRDR
jgi:hypothetical protein